jgi:peptide/nickel transport system substrate-binding protein
LIDTIFVIGGKLPKIFRPPNNNTINLFGATCDLQILCFVGVLALASACAKSSPPTGATVTFDLAADPRNLNPLFLTPDAASVELQVARLAFEPFIDLDARGRPQAALLEEIPSVRNGELSADGRTIRYRLRRGVQWSDGRPVTAGDVLFTLHAIVDRNNPVRSQEGYDLIERAVARDSRTVILYLKRAWAPAVMTYFTYGFSPQFVLPAHVLRNQTPLAQAAFNSAPTVGDGPFRFVAWTRGEGLRYAANPHYWRGKPKVAALDIRTVPSIGISSLRRNSQSFATTRDLHLLPCQRRLSRVWRSTPRTAHSTMFAFGARWQCRSIGRKSRKRSPWDTIR